MASINIKRQQQIPLNAIFPCYGSLCFEFNWHFFFVGWLLLLRLYCTCNINSIYDSVFAYMDYYYHREHVDCSCFGRVLVFLLLCRLENTIVKMTQRLLEYIEQSAALLSLISNVFVVVPIALLAKVIKHSTAIYSQDHSRYVYSTNIIRHQLLPNRFINFILSLLFPL